MIHKKNAEQLLKGTFISLDPSCGSQSSMPAYAIYTRGRLVGSGIIQLNLNKELPYRLKELSYKISKILDQYPQIDSAVVENIPVIPGKFSQKGLSSLLKSVGTIMGSFLHKGEDFLIIEIMPRSWRQFAPADYVKSDVGDAIMIGHATIKLCEKLYEPNKKNKGTKA